MDKRIEPDLFARLMRLSPDTRTDLFEFIGQTTICPDEIRRLADGKPANSAHTATKP